MRTLGIIFYATLLTFIGAALIVFSFNQLQPDGIVEVLTYLQSTMTARVIIGLSGLLIILISISFAQSILGRFQREKTIAFQTASGEVTISLTAVEDLIRRLTGIIPEIKELRPNVLATKKGILVDLRVILRTEANIPELTAKLQDLTRSRIQEVLGVEEQIVIKIHVAKIIVAENKDRKRKDADGGEPALPYGYRI